jgi:TrmH family RNA methyltransferase
MEPIRSPRNPRLLRVRSLARTSARREAGAFVIEGEDLVEAALRAGCSFEDLLVRDETPSPQGAGFTPLVVRGDILDSFSSLGSGTRQIGVVKTASLPQAPSQLTGLGVALCGVGDPGNVGTLLRSAAAFGADVAVLGAPSADPTGPKAVRAAMGATFMVPTLPVADVADAYPDARLVALDGHGDTDIADVDFSGPVLLALGAEREGLPVSVRKRAAVICRIPQSDRAESLNVAAAGAIALSLAFRSRSRG